MAWITSFKKRHTPVSITGMVLALALQWASSPAWSDTSLTLAEAMEHAMAKNPALQVFPLREKGLQGSAMTDALRPALEAGVEFENFAGSGDTSGTDSMDTTLSLSSVLELGNKRDARIAVADARINQLQAEREVAALDVSGEVARRFWMRFWHKSDLNCHVKLKPWLQRCCRQLNVAMTWVQVHKQMFYVLVHRLNRPSW